VRISFSSRGFTFVSDGVPAAFVARDYAVPDSPTTVVPTAATSTIVAATQLIKSQSYDIELPTTPTWSKTTTVAGLGPIGYAIDGAAIFNPYEGDGSTVALASNFTLHVGSESASFLDSCYGHPNPSGIYHYHGMPTCITSHIDTSHGPSHILGFALDGYPIYGDRAMDGNVVPLSKLDACNGIFSPTPEFPRGIYHYVMSDSPTDQSSLRCFHGVVAADLLRRSTPAGTAAGAAPPGIGPEDRLATIRLARLLEADRNC
jgi:hypothetical protein